MTVSLKHQFVSNVSDSADPTLVQPSNWNDEHLLTANANSLLGAVTAGNVVEITCTSAGRDILDDADASAQRTTLGAAASGSVTSSGITMNTSRLLGRTTASSGAIEEISVAGNLTLSGGTLTGSEFPSGTVIIFKQSAAPTGWTKITTDDDKAIRIVSGNVGTGGSVGFTTAFASQTPSGNISNTTATGNLSNTTATGNIANTTATGTVGDTTLATNQIPSHSHTYDKAGANTIQKAGSTSATPTVANLNQTSTASGNAGGGGSHTHSFTGTAHTHTFTGDAHNHTFTGDAHNHTFTGNAINLAVQYVDVIAASKD